MRRSTCRLGRSCTSAPRRSCAPGCGWRCSTTRRSPPASSGARCALHRPGSHQAVPMRLQLELAVRSGPWGGITCCASPPTSGETTVCLSQLSRTGSGTPSDTSGFDARLSALGRPSAEGSGEDPRPASEEAAPAVEGGSSDAPASDAAEAEAASSHNEVSSAVQPSATEEAADTKAPPEAEDMPLRGKATERTHAAQDELADGSEMPAESHGVEESDGHFTSTSQSTDGLLVRRDSRGHLSSSLSAKRVRMTNMRPCHNFRRVCESLGARSQYLQKLSQALFLAGTAGSCSGKCAGF